MASINNKFFEDLGTSPAVVALVNQTRDQVAAIARSEAPVDSGEYKAGITTGGKVDQRRYVGLVIATDSKSLLVESQRGTLARALRKVTRGGR